MLKETAQRLTDKAAEIEKYFSLHPTEQAWIYPLLNKSIQSAINVIDACSDKSRNYEEIAAICELHPNTVKQILYALAEGGISFTVDSSDRYLHYKPGRSRRLLLK